MVDRGPLMHHIVRNYGANGIHFSEKRNWLYYPYSLFFSSDKRMVRIHKQKPRMAGLSIARNYKYFENTTFSESGCLFVLIWGDTCPIYPTGKANLNHGPGAQQSRCRLCLSLRWKHVQVPKRYVFSCVEAQNVDSVTLRTLNNIRYISVVSLKLLPVKAGLL